MASPELSNFEFALAIYQNSWEKLRLPDKFAELLEGREPHEVKLREAGGGRRLREPHELLLWVPRKLWPVTLKHNIVFVAIAVLLFCILATPTTARADLMMDRWEQIPNVNTTEVQEIARWAVAEHARQANDGLQYKRVMSGMQQIVSGMNWKLRIDALNGDGIDCIYIAEVYDEPWTHTRTLDSFTPAQSTQGMCKLVVTSWSVRLACDLLLMILCVSLCVLLLCL